MLSDHNGLIFNHEEVRGLHHLVTVKGIPQPSDSSATTHFMELLLLAGTSLGLLTVIAAVCYVRRDEIYSLFWKPKKNLQSSQYGSISYTELTSIKTDKKSEDDAPVYYNPYSLNPA